MKHTGRAALAVALLVGFYAYGVGVLVGLGWLLVLALEHGLPGFLAGKGFLVLAVVAFAVVRSLFGLRKNASSTPPGLLLPPEEHPRLWDVVRHLGATVGTRPPDEIRLVPDVNAAVSEESSWLGLRPGRRRMFIGAPLLTTFSESELVSVLAHELGHYSGRHTAWGGLVYRSREAIGRTLERLQDHPVVSAPFRLYARFYVAVTAATSRAQELEADWLSVSVAGPATATRALLAIEPLAAAWSFFLETYALAGREDGLRPSDLFGGFELFLHDPERQRQIAELNMRAEPEANRWTDTHPPVAERVRAMESLGLADVDDTSAPAIELLGDYLDALRSLEDDMFAGSGLDPAGWDEVVGAGARRTWDQLSGLVTSTARERDDAPRLDGVLDAVADGRFRGYVAAVLVDPEAHAEEAQRELLDALCRSALVAGGARVRVNWSGPAHVLSPHAERLDPSPLVSASFDDPSGVRALREWLVANGASLDHEPPVSQAAADDREAIASRAPELLSVIGRVRCAGAFRSGGYCFLLTHGLVLRGMRLGDSAKGMGSYTAMLRAARRRTPDELLADRRAVFVPWDQVVRAEPFTRWRHQRVSFELVDGRSLTLKWLYDTQDDPTFLPSLAYFLGDRFEGS
ncbi:Zn-dependent protease with chaperone function [Nocardioides sp. BE266]|uniref:M48 family metallopeptidase n=1 Tax=Nocardioides sp. BE266 TaxID=2817725 RepID=UPI00285BAF85|nr:M48 family metallopeptidase [Nocardioides sp. BE266]MDR7255316.1 Zn-dependent protease with chaperone function [Nocardioides sp. BE266]